VVGSEGVDRPTLAISGGLRAMAGAEEETYVRTRSRRPRSLEELPALSRAKPVL